MRLARLALGLVVACGSGGEKVADQESRDREDTATERTGRMLAHDVEDPAPTIIVEVEDNGIWIAGKRVADNAIDEVFGAAAKKDPKTRVIFRASPSSTIERLMERAKTAGLSRLVIKP